MCACVCLFVCVFLFSLLNSTEIAGNNGVALIWNMFGHRDTNRLFSIHHNIGKVGDISTNLNVRLWQLCLVSNAYLGSMPKRPIVAICLMIMISAQRSSVVQMWVGLFYVHREYEEVNRYLA